MTDFAAIVVRLMVWLTDLFGVVTFKFEEGFIDYVYEPGLPEMDFSSEEFEATQYSGTAAELGDAVEIERQWQAEKLAKIEQEKTVADYFSHESVSSAIRHLTFLSETLNTLDSLEKMNFSNEINFLKSRQEIIEKTLKSQLVRLFIERKPSPEVKELILKKVAILKASIVQNYENERYDLVVRHTPEKGTYVEGDTWNSKDILKAAGLKWKPRQKYWGLLKTVGKYPNFDRLFRVALSLFKAGLMVRVDIEDKSQDDYQNALVVYLNDKAEAAQSRADNAGKQSQDFYQQSRQISDGIPMGQPVLTGHHSEKRHRRDLARINGKMAKSVAASRKSEHQALKAARYRQRAENISSETDPDAKLAKGIQLEVVAAFHELIRKELKKISPVIASCRKDAQGKGKRAWSFYTVSFHDSRMEKIRIHVQENRVDIGGYHINSKPVPFQLKDANSSFNFIKDFLGKYIEKTYLPIKIANEKMSCKFEVDNYWIEDKEDTANLPRAISYRESKKDILKTFKWAIVNQNRIEKMSFSELISSAVKEGGACPHSYCAMD